MIGKYRIFKQKTFESMSKFEARLNEECVKGWRAISLTHDAAGSVVVLLERENKH